MISSGMKNYPIHILGMRIIQEQGIPFLSEPGLSGVIEGFWTRLTGKLPCKMGRLFEFAFSCLFEVEENYV